MKWIVGIAVTWFLFHFGIAQSLLLALAGLGTLIFG
jgi:hypothetical protein